MVKSIEIQIAEAAYATFTTPAALDQIRIDPSLFHSRLAQLWPKATAGQIVRGVSIAAELLAADVAYVGEEFRRSFKVPSETSPARP